MGDPKPEAAQYADPPYWWQEAGGKEIISKTWELVEYVASKGVEVSVRFRKEHQPTLTIAFDWDVVEDEEWD